jgi:hypothetical protein
MHEIQNSESNRPRCLQTDCKIAPPLLRYKLIEAYHDKKPDLAVFVLQTMQRYINWVDINLIANPK